MPSCQFVPNEEGIVNDKNLHLSTMTWDKYTLKIGKNTEYDINCKKNLGLPIRSVKVFLQDPYEGYSLFLQTACIFPS